MVLPRCLFRLFFILSWRYSVWLSSLVSTMLLLARSSAASGLAYLVLAVRRLFCNRWLILLALILIGL